MKRIGLLLFKLSFFLIYRWTESKNVIVHVKGDLSILSPRKSNLERKQRVYDHLFHHTKNYQRKLVAFLKNESHLVYESLWIQNSIVVYNPSDDLINKLKQHKDVVQVVQDEQVHLLENTFFSPSNRSSTAWMESNAFDQSYLENAFPNHNNNNNKNYNTFSTTTTNIKVESNIHHLLAERLWLTGVKGKGIVVANIDSGVRYSHESLRQNYRGHCGNSTYNHDYSFWVSNSSMELTPDLADPHGHGTHTMGIAVGSNGIGMAPEATWITAQAFSWNGAAKQSDILLASQWIMCPTKYDKTAPNCNLGAHVVSNSFGGNNSIHWMDQVIRSWKLAGILPLFASGNTNGFQCQSILCPACNENAIAIGALAGKRNLWGASGKGPTMEGLIKPDFVAPGVGIHSALSIADNKYTAATGTSMATPHVAGAFALLLSMNTTLDNQQIFQIMKDSTFRQLHKPFLVPSICGNTSYQQYPNNIYGWGLPNVCQAAQQMGSLCNPHLFSAIS